MAHLYLADLDGYTEDEVKQHISSEYAGDKSGFDYGVPSAAEKEALRATLEQYDIVVAYESVGDYGCDSSSWFLLRHRTSGAYFENHGSHCSCYGFEGQFDPEEVTLEHLRSDKFRFYAGRYDTDGATRAQEAQQFLAGL